MVRRRFTVRFRNGTQVDDPFEKIRMGHGCWWGLTAAAGVLTARPAPLLPGPIRKGPEIPGPPVRSWIPSQPGGSERRAGPHRYWRRQIAGLPGCPRWQLPREEAEPHDGRGQALSAPARRRDHVTGPGAADRLGLDHGQPGGTGQAATVTAFAAGPVAARVLAAGAGDVRSVLGAGEIHAGLDDVLYARAGLAQRLAGQRQAQPGLSMRARRRGCGLSQAGLRAAGHQTYRHLRDVLWPAPV
jgi:hypothetical protein